MMEEAWRRIDADGEYEVSNLGRVRRVIDGSYRSDGYKCFLIQKDGKKKRMTGHRLVAQYFLNDGRPLERHQPVDHLNGKRDDNRAENLRITTHDVNSANVAAVRAAIKADLIKEMGLEDREQSHGEATSDSAPSAESEASHA